MTTSYPSALDSYTNPTGSDLTTSPDHAGQHADANDAIHAIETELAADPRGSFASVKERLNASSSWDAEIVKANTDSFTSTVSVNDSELFFTVDASSVYDIEYWFIYSSSSATQDFAYSFVYPALSLARQALGWSDELNTSDALSFGTGVGNTTSLWPGVGGRGAVGADSSNQFMAQGHFTLVANGSGTLNVKGATVVGSGTAKLWAGSRLRYKKLA